MLKKLFKKKEEKNQSKVLENRDNEVELNEEELESISGGIAPIMGPNDPNNPNNP